MYADIIHVFAKGWVEGLGNDAELAALPRGYASFWAEQMRESSHA